MGTHKIPPFARSVEAPMDFIPPVAQPLLLAVAPTFTHPTFQRWLLLCVAAIVTPGRRTIRLCK
jgi:hypothetical protein